MFRTRDFALFFFSFCFLLAMISGALLPDRQSNLATFDASEQTATVTYGVAPSEPPPVFDRAGTIDRLKAKVAQSDYLALANPSVPRDTVFETESDQENAPDPDADPESESGTLTRCAGASDGFVVASQWPRDSVSVDTVGGSRMVVSTVGSSTVALLQLPVVGFKSGSSCIDSDAIGVTPSGSLIFNGDAAAYLYTGSDVLVGYARDGFPIYGNYTGPTDSCGGYDHPSGYRYSVSGDRPNILNCFSGTPQPFLN